MRITCLIPKAKNKYSVSITRIAFPLQLWLYERASVLRYTGWDKSRYTVFFFFTYIMNDGRELKCIIQGVQLKSGSLTKP